MLKEECCYSATPYVPRTCAFLVDTSFSRRMPWVHIKELGQGKQWRYVRSLLFVVLMMMAQDAYILSRLLTEADATNLSSQIPLITRVYDAIRRPIGNAVLALTKTCGKLTGLVDDEKKLPFVKAGDETVPHEILMAYIKKVEHHWQWLWDDSAPVEDQRQDALKLLRELRKPESKM